MFGYDNKQITVIGGILMLVVILMAIGMSMPEGGSGIPATEAGDSGGGIDPNPAGVDPSVSAPQVEPTMTETVEVITTTAPVSQELKLLKKVGPTKFPPFGARISEITLVTQKAEFEVDDLHIIVGSTSFKDPSVAITNKRTGKHLVILVLLRNSYGDLSLCKEDEETGSYYFSKSTLYPNGLFETEYAVPSSRGTEAKRNMDLYSWEVLVYG